MNAASFVLTPLNIRTQGACTAKTDCQGQDHRAILVLQSAHVYHISSVKSQLFCASVQTLKKMI